jgi:hypothetical protein
MDHHPMHLHGYQFRITQTDGGQIPESAQQVETTVLVQTGSTKTIEFTADAPGDWALHCHMTHHLMTQMGHGIPNLIGVQAGELDQKMRRLLPAYMTMGQAGMAEMADMHMEVPANSIPMAGAAGPFDTITMGGMFTLLKVREGIESFEDPGWYEHPAGKLGLPCRERGSRAGWSRSGGRAITSSERTALSRRLSAGPQPESGSCVGANACPVAAQTPTVRPTAIVSASSAESSLSTESNCAVHLASCPAK